MSGDSLDERMEAAQAAKRAMLEKFKNKAAPDPAVVAERAAQAKARDAKRAEAEAKRRKRVEDEKAMRALEAEQRAAEAELAAKRSAEDAAAKLIADAEAEEIQAFEQKARRDLKYAQRKERQGKKR